MTGQLSGQVSGELSGQVSGEAGGRSVGGGLPPLPSTSQPPAGAIVGKTLSDFRWVDVKVVGRGGPEIPNIQQVAPGVFKCILRQGNGWHDGNLKAGRQDHKGRAELCCLGGNTPYKIGETWLIGATTLFDPRFMATSYCQIAQPVLHQSYFNMNKSSGNQVSGGLYVFERGLGSASRLVRNVTVEKGKWFTWVVRVTFGENGSYGLSINGDSFGTTRANTAVGHKSMNQVGRVGAFGGTFGLYMPMGGPPRDVIVYHANMFIKKV